MAPITKDDPLGQRGTLGGSVFYGFMPISQLSRVQKAKLTKPVIRYNHKTGEWVPVAVGIGEISGSLRQILRVLAYHNGQKVPEWLRN